MKFRRSPREILDRSLQELRNLALFLRPPRLRAGNITSMAMPAAEIPAHRFPLVDFDAQTGADIAWRRDNENGIETGLSYFRRIPYLDAKRAGDHKVIWELNRHQHLAVLAQDEANLDEIVRQLKSWMDANPFHRGINWTSALEVAFRALSWMWIYDRLGAAFDERFRHRFLEELYRHGRHLENNLSFYFSPNTHLLGEGVVLHALGVIFPQFPHARRWRETGRRVVHEQMEKQVRADGAHFEQSTYYHVYALDMFQFHATLETPEQAYRAKLWLMAEFLHAVMGPPRRLPLLGDDDGGRFISVGRPEIDAPFASRLFADSGIAVMTAGDLHIVMDAGPFGPWGSGHSHSDTLSLIVRKGNEDILIDPGTYTYVGDTGERDWFRGSAAHNTIRIDGRDQAIPAGPFRWTDQPKVEILDWNSDLREDRLVAQCCYAGFTHKRTTHFLKPDRLIIDDEIHGPPGEHTVEQFWHLGSEAAQSRFKLDPGGNVSVISSWASPAYGEKHAAPALLLCLKSSLPLRLHTEIECGSL